MDATRTFRARPRGTPVPRSAPSLTSWPRWLIPIAWNGSAERAPSANRCHRPGQPPQGDTCCDQQVVSPPQTLDIEQRTIVYQAPWLSTRVTALTVRPPAGAPPVASRLAAVATARLGRHGVLAITRVAVEQGCRKFGTFSGLRRIIDTFLASSPRAHP